jgi:hypothetical protein
VGRVLVIPPNPCRGPGSLQRRAEGAQSVGRVAEGVLRLVSPRFGQQPRAVARVDRRLSPATRSTGAKAITGSVRSATASEPCPTSRIQSLVTRGATAHEPGNG